MGALARAICVAAPLFVACGGYSTTTRLVNGETLTSNPVAPQAYALYLEATIEEASGNLQRARETYLAATQFEGHNAELWTRVGDLSCRLDLSSADDEFATALEGDQWYAPAWIARSRCELKRGNAKRALEFARQAQVSAADDLETTEAMAVALTRVGDPEAAHRQWVAYTTLHPHDRRGWRRLAASGHELRKPVWEAWARAALGVEEPPAATTITNGQADIPAELVAAILSDDLRAARAFATDHSLPQVVVLEWATKLGRHQMAMTQADVLVAAYPTSSDVRALALLAAARGTDEVRLERWLDVPEGVSPLTAIGKQALQDLVRERCGEQVILPSAEVHPDR